MVGRVSALMTRHMSEKCKAGACISDPTRHNVAHNTVAEDAFKSCCVSRVHAGASRPPTSRAGAAKTIGRHASGHCLCLHLNMIIVLQPYVLTSSSVVHVSACTGQPESWPASVGTASTRDRVGRMARRTEHWIFLIPSGNSSVAEQDVHLEHVAC